MDYLSLCLICKDENDYLPEWLDYHILMGVDRFYIYDNESKISLRESLVDYIERGWVVVVDISGKAMQLYAYDHCLQTYGVNTFWMGFIDSDEFLVPKSKTNLKNLLKDYDAYAGLAVSSLFFGSADHKTRPAEGQIAAYTRRTHPTFKENELIKCIVQPGLVSMPNSPHDFIFKENSWCVNENFLRVDGQHFANNTACIQLNHYFCRSESEIDLKLRRGNSGAIAWSRRRFDAINKLSVYDDVSILENLDFIFKKAGLDSSGMANSLHNNELLAKMSVLSHSYNSNPLVTNLFGQIFNSREGFVEWMDIKAKGRLAESNQDYEQAGQMLLALIQLQPQYPKLYVDLSINYLRVGDLNSAWQTLTRAWQIAPNTYAVLLGMVLFFLRVKNYAMVEKTCHLILGIAPHNLRIQGHLTEALLGQDRFEEALKIGVPVVTLSALVGELPEGMGVFLVKKMADYLLEKKDFSGAVSLWKAGVLCQPDDMNAQIDLARVLLMAGDKTAAHQVLVQVQALDPQNGIVLELIKQSAITKMHLKGK